MGAIVIHERPFVEIFSKDSRASLAATVVCGGKSRTMSDGSGGDEERERGGW